MKKKSLVLLLALMLSVTACGEEPEVTGSNDSATVESQVENDVNEGTEAEQESEPVAEVKVSVAENFTYTEENGEIIITGYEGDATVLEIPESINGMSVVATAENSFAGNETITEVVFPDSIKVVGDSSFERCSNLTKVVLGKNVEEIENGAFWMTSLEAIELPETLRNVGGFSFDHTNIKELIIPASVEVIEAAAFGSINIETLIIPGTVKTIGEQAFRYCPDLKTVVIEEGVEIIEKDAFADCDLLESITFPTTLTELDKGVVSGSGSSESIVNMYVPAGSVAETVLNEKYPDSKYYKIISQ